MGHFKKQNIIIIKKNDKELTLNHLSYNIITLSYANCLPELTIITMDGVTNCGTPCKII